MQAPRIQEAIAEVAKGYFRSEIPAAIRAIAEILRSASHKDRGKIAELYEPDWKAWFGEEGDPRHDTPDDPRIVLIAVSIQAAVFLEVDKPKPVVLFELAKGWLTGEKAELGETHVLAAPHRSETH